MPGAPLADSLLQPSRRAPVVAHLGRSANKLKHLLLFLALCLASSCHEGRDSKADEIAPNNKLTKSRVVLEGIDFENAESIKDVLKGVTLIRGDQDTTLALDDTMTLNIIESSDFPGFPVTFRVGDDGVVLFTEGTQMSREEFTEKLKSLSKYAEINDYCRFAIMVVFNSGVSGMEGHKILKNLCGDRMRLMLKHEKTR